MKFQMEMKNKTKMVFSMSGRFVNEAISFIIFCVLDVLDAFLCFAFKMVDFFVEAEWKPCYCSSPKEVISTNSGGKIFVLEHGESKIVRLSCAKLQLDEISDTLYSRPSLVSEFSKFTANEFRRLKLENNTVQYSYEKNKNGKVRSTFSVNSTVIEMLQAKIGGHKPKHVPRWSDCHCLPCNSWSRETLYFRAQGPIDKPQEDVLFIHGFISSSAFWTETVFPNFSSSVKSSYRLIAIDLLGFGRSPKPADSLYTLREHLEMIEKTVIEPYQVKSFHIVAHSLGCILALALAVKHPGLVKSLTLLAPPYFPVPKGEIATQYVMKMVAPRRVWPLISFGASIGCWYEHITRITCLILSKNHRLWEFLAKLVTLNSVPTFLIEGFFCHTHNAAWHTLHNIICGTAGKLDAYLDIVRERLSCDINIIHGQNDELIPVECSYHVQSKIPRARVKVIENKDHITIVVGRQKAFARELEEIWRRSKSS